MDMSFLAQTWNAKLAMNKAKEKMAILLKRKVVKQHIRANSNIYQTQQRTGDKIDRGSKTPIKFKKSRKQNPMN